MAHAQTVKFDPLKWPAEVLIGEEFTFTLEFQNTSGVVGFVPFIDLVLDYGGIDENDLLPNPPNTPGPCDGVQFVSARVMGINPGPITITPVQQQPTGPCNAWPTTVPHPFGGIVVMPPGQLGQQLVTLPLAFPNYDPQQPKIVIEITARVHSFADWGQPLRVYARGGFRSENEFLTPPPIPPTIAPVSAWDWEAVTPNPFTLKKEFVGPLDPFPIGETASGPNYSRQYMITADIAEGQTITDLQVQDLLLAGVAYEGIVSVSVNAQPGAEVQSCFNAGPADYMVDTSPPFSVQFCSPIAGQAGVEDEVVVTFEFYIEDVHPKDCTHTAFINDIKGMGQWLPQDPRDAPAQAIQSDATAEDHQLRAKCLPIQKTVEVYQEWPSGGLGPTPGDILKYTLLFQVSDYKTIGDVVIEDFLSDGQTVIQSDPNVPDPTLTVGDQFGDYTGQAFGTTTLLTAPSTASCRVEDLETKASYQVTGGTQLTFKVSDLLTSLSNAPPRHAAGILTGGLAAKPPTALQSPARGSITFYARIEDAFKYQSPPPGEKTDFVDKHDPMLDCVRGITGRVYTNEAPADMPVPLIHPTVTTGDSTYSLAIIVFDEFEKSLYAVKRPGVGFVCGGGTSPCPNPIGLFDVRPSDWVTFRLRMTVPSGDAESLTIRDWLPLPVLAVNDPKGVIFPLSSWSLNPVDPIPPCPASVVPQPGEACMPLPTHTLPVVPTWGQPDPVSNRIEFNYGIFNSTANKRLGIDLLYTVVANAKPLADSLPLTNEAQECEENSVDEASTQDAGRKFCQAAIDRIRVREPNLRITKGVVATDNPHAEFSRPPVPPGFQFSPLVNPPACSWKGGPITSAQLAAGFFNADLLSADANDHVTYTIVIENGGGAPAYNIALKDSFPFSHNAFICIEPGKPCVTDGTGAPVSFSVNTTSNGVMEIEILSALPGTYAAPGKNIIVITITGTLRKDISSGCCVNTAQLTRYTSSPDGMPVKETNFVGQGIGTSKDAAQVCVGPSAWAKCVQTTSEANTLNTPSLSNPLPVELLSPGEIVRYRLIATVPEGVSPDFQITDFLPPGLTYLGNSEVIFFATNPIPGWPTARGDETTVTCPGGLLPGKVMTAGGGPFTPGTGADPIFIGAPITNSDWDPDLELVVIEFNALVDNVAANVDGKLLTDQFQVCSGTGSSTVCDTSGDVDVRVVEPLLTVTKDADTPSGIVIGGMADYTLTITNTGTATAFDVIVVDSLPPCITSASVGGLPSGVADNTTGSVLSFVIPSIEVGGSITIPYQATIACAECEDLENTAHATWTSLPGPGTSNNPTGSVTPGNSGAIDGERNGSSAPSSLNDYSASAHAKLCTFCVDLPAGAVAWWPLDEQAGATAVSDISGTNNVGTPVDMGGVPGAIAPNPFIAGAYPASTSTMSSYASMQPGLWPGMVSTGMAFWSSGSGYVKVPSNSSLNFGSNELTIDAWVYCMGCGVPGAPCMGCGEDRIGIVDKLDTADSTGYAFYVQSGLLAFVMADGTNAVNFKSTSSVPLKSWHHVAVTVRRASNGGTFYIDGVPAGIFDPLQVPGSISNTADVWIGRARIKPLVEFALDEIEIFQRELPAAEIQSIADAGEEGKCKPSAGADLGDAPDRTNSFNANMTAYSGTPANFPTVFAGGGGVVGPKHLEAKGLAWLGRAVTVEDEADQGPDADIVNNIIPAANQADHDVADDGVTLPLSWADCGPMQFPFTVTIPGPAPTTAPLFINVWFDFNRDGDWADPHNGCQNAPSPWPEWVVKDYTIPAGTGPGTAIPFMTPTFYGGKPGQDMWMRITLSEQPAPSPGDGRGPASGYQIGETEDYLISPVQPAVQDTICVIKFDDRNGDGVQAPSGEPGLAGWQIIITPPGTSATTSGPNGTACFVVPSPGTYVLEEVAQSGWTSTTPTSQSVAVAPPASTAYVEFGNRIVSVGQDTICVTKFDDLNGNGVKDPPSEKDLSGWQITVTPLAGGTPTTVTTDSLQQICATVPYGTYEVAEQHGKGWVATTPAMQTVNAVAPSSTNHVQFGNKRSIISVPLVPPVLAPVVPPEEPTVSEICGIAFEDLNGNGIQDRTERGLAGWTIGIQATAGRPASVTTDALGRYCIRVPSPGTYSITSALPRGWTATTSPTRLVRVPPAAAVHFGSRRNVVPAPEPSPAPPRRPVPVPQRPAPPPPREPAPVPPPRAPQGN